MDLRIAHVCEISKDDGLYLDPVMRQLGRAKEYETKNNGGSIQVYIETDMSNEKLSRLGNKILRLVDKYKKSGHIPQKVGCRYIHNK